MCKIKTEDVYEDISSSKMFDLGNCSAKSKYYGNSKFKRFSG